MNWRMKMKYKKILLFVIFILIIAIPISYANTNVSDEIGINNENEPVLMKNSNEYYFNSSLPNDGIFSATQHAG